MDSECSKDRAQRPSEPTSTDPRPPRWIGHPLLWGALVGGFVLATSVACIHVVARESLATYRAQYRQDLERLALATVAQLDVAQHDAIRDPAQQDGADYAAAVAPLRRVLGRTDGVRYLYTVIDAGEGVQFVLDASDPGDHDGDGRDDQAKILEHYPDAEPAMLECLETGHTTSSVEPMPDEWGRFLTGYAPILDDSGAVRGALGVDVTAERFDADLARMQASRDFALFPAILLSLAAGACVTLLRRAERRAAGQRDLALAASAEKASELLRANEGLALARVAAEASSRAKSEFLANMSHEIRTPMTAILGFAHLLGSGEELADEAQRADAANTIVRNAEHLLAVLNDVLDISKIEAGQMKAELAPTDVAQLAREVIALERARAEQKHIALELVFVAPPPARLSTDALRLRQILLNLVGNAIKFTERGSVTLEVRWESGAGGNALSFAVRDTGIGITPAQQTQLFRVFSQADGSMSRRFGGTGLGLTISRRLAQLLGGEITVSSALGEGSTFRVVLPIAGGGEDQLDEGQLAADERAADERNLASDTTRAALPASASGPRALAGLRVLLAEDGRDNQRLISLHLRRAGAVVDIVENGRQAVRALCDEHMTGDTLLSPAPFDVLLLDMQMPELDGYAAARRLRELGVTLPIVALTAHAMSGDRERCLAAGCNEYLTKPIDRALLLATLERVASGVVNSVRAAR